MRFDHYKRLRGLFYENKTMEKKVVKVEVNADLMTPYGEYDNGGYWEFSSVKETLDAIKAGKISLMGSPESSMYVNYKVFENDKLILSTSNEDDLKKIA